MLLVYAMSLGMFHPQSVTFTALKLSNRHACWQNGHRSSGLHIQDQGHLERTAEHPYAMTEVSQDVFPDHIIMLE